MLLIVSIILLIFAGSAFFLAGVLFERAQFGE